MFRAAAWATGAMLAVAGTALAQEAAPPAPPFAAASAEATILVLRQEELFEASAFGRAALARRDAASRSLIAENRQIEAALEAEERALTERRATLAPSDFRKLAEEFNDRVEGIRDAQDAKARSIGRLVDEDRARFLREVVPVLAEIMAERGALAILDQQSVILSFDRIDITAEAIARIDSRIGAGDVGAEPGEAAPAAPSAP